MEMNRTMRNMSGEQDGSTEKKDILEWSDVVLAAKEQGGSRGGLVKCHPKSRKSLFNLEGTSQ